MWSRNLHEIEGGSSCFRIFRIEANPSGARLNDVQFPALFITQNLYASLKQMYIWEDDGIYQISINLLFLLNVTCMF